MRKVMQIFRIRKIGSLLLVLLALVAVFPVFFSVTGSLMGQKELNDLLGAVLTADSGSAHSGTRKAPRQPTHVPFSPNWDILESGRCLPHQQEPAETGRH